VNVRSPTVWVLAATSLLLCARTTTRQQASSDFKPPQGDYKLVVMRPEVNVGLLTAGGIVEPREDWTNQARSNLLAALEKQQASRGGKTVIATTLNDAGADPALVANLNKLHEAVGRTIQLHKYTPGFDLPTKKGKFDWTLGEQAVQYGQLSGSDYALFLYASDSFSSGGRVALQAVSFLGCVVGVCVMPTGGQQVAFASLVDLKTGQVTWFNYLTSTVGDIREPQGAEVMVQKLLDSMKAAKAPAKS
jgi:hypothetical protein